MAGVSPSPPPGAPAPVQFPEIEAWAALLLAMPQYRIAYSPLSDGSVAIQTHPAHSYGAYVTNRNAVIFARTCVWLNQGAASAEHLKAGVRTNRSTKAASRVMCLPYNRNPFVEDPHPSFPAARKLGRNCTQTGYTPFATEAIS